MPRQTRYLLGTLVLPAFKRLVFFLSLSLIMSSQSIAEKDAPLFISPIDCQIGVQCFIQNYVDVDPSPGFQDYSCGFLSYNGHKGTDFRLPNLAKMHEGVMVLASAPGVVRAVRDGMPDINVKTIDESLIENRLAGNSVAIQHGNGWESQYSHLRKGSVMVKPGEKVTAGQALGLVGLSGNTEFPHLHFTVRHKGKVIDPFTGINIGAGCNHSVENSLWDENTIAQLNYQASGILEGGFTDNVPKIKPVHEYIKKKESLPQNTMQILFWTHVFGVRQGDTQKLIILDPNGKIFAKKETQIDKNQARRLAIIGKRLNEDFWLPGKYTGQYILSRADGDDMQNVINETFYLNVLSTD